MPSRMACSVLAPKPLSSRTAPFLAARSRSPMESTWSCSYSAFTPLGPRPLIAMRSESSGGTRAETSSSRGRLPVSTTVRIFPARSSPMPG